MGFVQKDAIKTTLISSFGLVLGYLNKGLLFLLILSTEEIGVINLCFSLGILFAQFSNFGTIYTIWKFFPFFKNKEKKHHGFLSFILLIGFAGILITSLLFLLFQEHLESIYIKKSALFIQYFIWIIPIGVGYVLYLILDVYLRALFKNIVSVFALDIVLRLGVTLILILLWARLISFDLFVAIHGLLFLLPPIILVVFLFKIKELHLGIKNIRVSSKFRKIIFNYAAFNYINSLGSVLVNSLDIIMVAQYIGLRATGVYSTVVFLTSALQVPYKSLVRVSSPLVSEYWKSREMDKMKDLYTRVSSVSLVVGLGLFLLVWVNIDFLFSFLKYEFKAGIWVFFFLMMGRLMDMFFGLNGSIFNTSKKYKYDVVFTLFLIFAVYYLNTIMIPLWGMSGAAISTALAFFVYNIGRMIFVYFIYKIHPFNKNQFIIIGIGILTLITCSFLNNLFINEWIQMLFNTSLAILLFFGSIFLFSLEQETINYTKQMKKKLFN